MDLIVTTIRTCEPSNGSPRELVGAVREWATVPRGPHTPVVKDRHTEQARAPCDAQECSAGAMSPTARA
jgi:hypothetical protein